MMRLIRSKIVDLVSAANSAEKTLKTISRMSTNAAKLSTRVIYGCLGFTTLAIATFTGLAVASWLAYAPFLVPIAGICGLLIGVLVSRNGTDRANERATDLIDQVWAIRDREMEGLIRQIKDARRTKSPRLSLLEQKMAFLELAPPEQLIDYYGLIDQKPPGRDNQPLLGPSEVEIRAAWNLPVRQLENEVR